MASVNAEGLRPNIAEAKRFNAGDFGGDDATFQELSDAATRELVGGQIRSSLDGNERYQGRPCDVSDPTSTR
ncbi:MAG: hypothetical protein V9H25_21600 [Candidatus Competibacter sp.]